MTDQGRRATKALSEKHRSTLYNQLGTTVGDYDAVGALLSNIATQELDQPASREFVAAQFETLRTEIGGLRTAIEGLCTNITGSEGRLAPCHPQEFDGIRSEFSGIRSEFIQLREAVEGLRSDTITTNRWMIGLVIALVGGLLASQFIGTW